MITLRRDHNLILAAAAFALLGARVMLAQGAPINGTAHLQLSPASTSVAVGGPTSIAVGVDLTGVTGQGPSGTTPAVLGGFQIAVTFDRTRLQFTGASGGSAPFNSAPTFTSPSAANAAGMVTIVGSQTSATTPTGNITVANLSFTALSGGSAAVSASATSLSSAYQPPSSGPASIPSNGAAVSVTLLDVPGAVSSPSPANGAVNVPTPVTLGWAAASGATSYDVYLGKNSTPVYVITTQTLSQTVSVGQGFDYTWRVVAKNAAGTTAGPLWSFTTTGPPPPPSCAVPAAPQLTAPPTADSGATYSLSWAAVTSATDYVIEESADGTFASSSSTTVSASNTSASFMKSVTSDTTFYYRMLARNTAAGCLTTSPYSTAVTVIIHAPVVPQTRRLVIPVAGSLAGAFGSTFKTAVQLTNPTAQTISGRLVFHPAEASGSDADPALQYQLAPGETRYYADLLPQLGLTGIGSADLITTDSVPVGLIRIFNDGGNLGTTGMTVDLIGLQDALGPGDSTILTAPADPSVFRFNIGVRTLDLPVTLSVTIRNRQGATVNTLTKTYAPQFFVQVSDANFIGSPASLSGSDTLTISVISGSAIVYGATTDNRTQDPSLQIGRRVPK